MDQTQILDPSFYATTSAANASIIPIATTSTHIPTGIPFDQYQQASHQQAYIYNEQQQQQQQQQYQSIDFFYETPQIQPTPSSSHTYTTTNTTTNTINNIIPTASTSYQTPMVKRIFNMKH